MSDWKMKRGEQEWAVGTPAMLKEWASGGRIAADDYVFNPILGKWMYAREIAEIAPFFGAKVAKQRRAWMNRSSWMLFILSVLLLFISPILSSLVFLVAILFAIAYYVAPAA